MVPELSNAGLGWPNGCTTGRREGDNLGRGNRAPLALRSFARNSSATFLFILGDSVLCALVGEHILRLSTVFAEFYGVLRPGGRLTFSLINPELAAAGEEVRLGAEPTTEQQYLDSMDQARFADFERREYHGDKALYAQVPKAAKFAGTPLLLVLEAKRLG